MRCEIINGKIIWSYKGENICLEGCGIESIRVRASFKCPIDFNLNYNLETDTEVPVRIFQIKKGGSCEENIGGDEGHCIDIKEGRLVLEYGRTKAEVEYPGRIKFFYDGKEILKEEWIDESCGMPPFQKAREYRGIGSKCFRIQSYFHANKGEHIYGMGQESRNCLDLKGCTVDLCQKNTKCTIPFYISTLGYGFLWNNPAVGRAELVENRFMWEAEMTRQLDYVVVGGGTPQKVMEHYTFITGRIPHYPEWTLGLWQSKLRYRTQEEVLDIAAEYKMRNIPLSVLVIDYFHWPNQGDWKFDERYFPNPKEMNDTLRAKGIHLMVSVWPTVDMRSENYNLLSEEGCLMTAEQGPDVFFICRGGETYLDLTYDRAGKILFQKLKKNYIEHGITSFWLDEAEPEIYPYDYGNMRLAAGNGLEVSNYYPYAYNKKVEEALIEDGVWGEGNSADGIILARSGWIGSQRLRSVIWSGDVPSTFESFRKQIIAGLEMAMCGIVFWTTDIGGFYGGNPQNEEFRELMIRWFQFGVFCPVLRMHGYRMPYEEEGGMSDMSGECSSGGPNELWSFGERAYHIMLNYLNVRMRMIPYIRKQLEIARETGTPLMRPLVYDFPEDKNVYDLEDEYMFGSRILVAPVVEYGARRRSVYLPGEGMWIDALTKKQISGNTVITVDAPLDRMPVFYRMKLEAKVIGET